MGKPDKKIKVKDSKDKKAVTNVNKDVVQKKAIVKPIANGKVKPSKKAPSSDEESSESSSESEVDKKSSKVKGKAGKPTLTASKKAVSSGNSDDSSNESSSEDEKSAKINGKKVSKTEESSESDSGSDTDSSDEKPVVIAQSKPSAAAKPAPSSSSEEDSDSSVDTPKKSPTKLTPANKSSASTTKPAATEESDSDDSEEISDEEDAPKSAIKEKKPAAESTSSSEESGEEESPAEKAGDVEMADPTIPAKTKRKADDSQDVSTKKVKLADGKAAVASSESQEETKVCFIGKLSWNVDNDWLASEFADCGEVISARVQMDRNTGKSKGFGFVEFATTDAVNAAIALNGQKEIDGRVVNIDKTTPRAPNPEKRAKIHGDVPSEPSSVLFVGNVSFDTTEDNLWEVFSDYGEVKSVRLPTDRETQRAKGFGYVEFTDIGSAKKAFEGASGMDIGGRSIRLDYSQPRTEGGGGGGGRGRGRGGFGGGGDRGWGGRGGGGDRGGRGRGGFGGGRGGGSRGRGGGRGAPRGGARTGGAVEFKGERMTF